MSGGRWAARSTRIVAEFRIPDGEDPEEAMYRIQEQAGIEFDEFSEVTDIVLMDGKEEQR